MRFFLMNSVWYYSKERTESKQPVQNHNNCFTFVLLSFLPYSYLLNDKEVYTIFKIILLHGALGFLKHVFSRNPHALLKHLVIQILQRATKRLANTLFSFWDVIHKHDHLA